MYPARERLVEGLKPDGGASAFVDVGGSMGQILQNFRADVPQYTGWLVLQELPEVIAVAADKGVGAGGRIELGPRLLHPAARPGRSRLLHAHRHARLARRAVPQDPGPAEGRHGAGILSDPH